MVILGTDVDHEWLTTVWVMRRFRAFRFPLFTISRAVMESYDG